MKIAPRLPPWNRCDDGSSGSELGWSNIPSGVKELVLASEDDELHDLQQIFTEFYPRCSDILQADDYMKETYDWNLPCSIRAAYVIAGDMYLEGKPHKSVLMVFFAALLLECMSNSASLVLNIFILLGSENNNTVNRPPLNFAHIHQAVVNTQTASLLLDFISEMHPNRGWAQKLKPMSNEQQSSLDRPLSVDNTIHPIHPKLKLVTLFLRVEADQYREFQVCEYYTLQQLFIV